MYEILTYSQNGPVDILATYSEIHGNHVKIKTMVLMIWNFGSYRCLLYFGVHKKS